MTDLGVGASDCELIGNIGLLFKRNGNFQLLESEKAFPGRNDLWKWSLKYTVHSKFSDKSWGISGKRVFVE